MSSPAEAERKISLSNVRSLKVGVDKVIIGEYMIDQIAEANAERVLQQSYPNLLILSTPEGKRQIPLQDILVLESQFQSEKKDAREEGFQAGQKDGYEAGLDKGREEARRAVTALSGAISDATRQRHKMLEESKAHILEMVLKISKKLTFGAARIDSEITMKIISDTINGLLDKSKIKLKVHPDHLPEMELNIDRFQGNNTAIKEITIEADPRVRVGGCFIETASGDIDARLESMYDIILQAIGDGVGDES